ncbi:phage tail sheath family protein [Phytohabitans sp. LJ34]|uniref:phage tail sheath family protein n=1 Tax=Phytohabitans sp. LJ34 TaxID=3452217 RepID=UPI003F8C03C8
MPNLTTPGVFIEEIPATGPIAGVGTSTAAFIGPALVGDVNVPVKITNWTQFRDTFGDYMTAPRGYLAHAVRGFFLNGGTVCYVVRVGTARRAVLELNDRGGTPGKALVVRARDGNTGGAAGNDIKLRVSDAQIVDQSKNARVRKASAPITGAANDTVTLQNAADAGQFRPGDVVTVGTGTDRFPISRITGATLVLESVLGTPSGAGTVRIANLVPGQKTFRVENRTGIQPGSAVRLAQGTTQEDAVATAVDGEFVTFAAGLTKGYNLAGTDNVAVTTSEFTLAVTFQGVTETFPNLAMDPRHNRYVIRTVESAFVDVSLPDVPSVQPPPTNRPAVVTDVSLAGGTADTPAAVTVEDYAAALAALERVDDINVVCVPGRTDPAVQQAVINHCERMADRFAILDSAPKAGLSGSGSVLEQRAGIGSSRGYAALYYPWLSISDPSGSGAQTLLVPPSGHLAGVYARSDGSRGVHRAPANETIAGALGLERVLSDADQGELNIEGVNVLRVFGGGQPQVWGARTTAPRDETAWRYVNVRRLFLFMEESIQEGIRWAVFEPNNESLWKRLDRTITDFLTRVWSSGALFGASPEEAFYVKIDSENNPPSLRELGQIVIEIGVNVVRPAEFVVVRIGMWPGGAQVTEG